MHIECETAGQCETKWSQHPGSLVLTVFMYTMPGREIVEKSERALWNSHNEGYTEENLRIFVSACNRRVLEADLKKGADFLVLGWRLLRNILKGFKSENNL